MQSILNESNHRRYNPGNERIVKKYLEHVRRTKLADNKTLLALRKYLRAFEVLTDFQDLDRYTPDMAKVFLANLRQQSVSPSYMHRITSETQKFIRWLADEPFGRRIRRNDADYLTLTRNEINRANASGYKPHHEYSQLLHAVRTMPAQTVTDLRNRALVALVILTSPRVSELCNFRIDTIMQEPLVGIYFLDINPRKIKNVKFCRAREATLLNIPDLRQFVLDWRDMLVNEYDFDKSDPLFPKIAINPFQLNIFERNVKAQPISVCTANQIFNGACVANGLAPLSIHSVRRTRARHIENITHDDRIVALQQDFGHSSIGTTRCNYGNISPSRQRELIAGIKVE
ncbi:MAG: tyrosine-type recombinase/integrase [Alphaproteobacteria bacterium]|nr:tyrosine-type recombinase/integrase [Alphaproteobacteria bacterium]